MHACEGDTPANSCGEEASGASSAALSARAQHRQRATMRASERSSHILAEKKRPAYFLLWLAAAKLNFCMHPATSRFSAFLWILYFRKPAWLTEQTAFSLQVGRLNRLGSGEPPIQRTRGKRTIVRHRKARPLTQSKSRRNLAILTQPQGWGESSQCQAKYIASDKLGNWRNCAGVRTSLVASAKRTTRHKKLISTHGRSWN